MYLDAYNYQSQTECDDEWIAWDNFCWYWWSLDCEEVEVEMTRSRMYSGGVRLAKAKETIFSSKDG